MMSDLARRGNMPAGRHTVSCAAIRKSGRVLYAFSHFYFPFYGRSPSDVFWEYDPFACISALVYDIDAQVEAGLDPEATTQRLGELGEFLRAWVDVDSEVASLLEDARRYYEFERSRVQGHGSYTLDELVAVTAIRSFDFRLMHRTLAQASGMGYREQLFAWFRRFEILMEIEDDLTSVEEDALRCTFNIAALALRASPEEGAAFVSRARDAAEKDVVVGMAELPRAEGDLCASTLAAYRTVVPIPASCT